MSVKKPRVRIVPIRFSEEEYEAVCQAMEMVRGARSLSDFIRRAVLETGENIRNENPAAESVPLTGAHRAFANAVADRVAAKLRENPGLDQPAPRP